MVYIIMSLVRRAQITNYILTIVLIEKSMIKLNKFLVMTMFLICFLIVYRGNGEYKLIFSVDALA